MYFYRIELSNQKIYIIKSDKTNIELLNSIARNEWCDYLLAENKIVYVGSERIENNVVMIKSSEIVALEYYVEDVVMV